MDDALDSEPEVTAETEELSETEPVLDEVEQPTRYRMMKSSPPVEKV